MSRQASCSFLESIYRGKLGVSMSIQEQNSLYMSQYITLSIPAGSQLLSTVAKNSLKLRGFPKILREKITEEKERK